MENQALTGDITQMASMCLKTLTKGSNDSTKAFATVHIGKGYNDLFCKVNSLLALTMSALEAKENELPTHHRESDILNVLELAKALIPNNEIELLDYIWFNLKKAA